jgi:hypothetical protein
LCCQRCTIVQIKAVNLYWPSDVLQVLSAEFTAREMNLPLDEVQDLARNADTAADSNTLKARSDIHTVTEHVAAVLDHVTYVDPHPEFDAPVGTDLRIARSHPTLNFEGAFYRIDHARELDEYPIAHRLKDASVVLLDFGITERTPMCLQGCERALFISSHQLAIARDVSREDCCETPLDVLPHRLGSACSELLTLRVRLERVYRARLLVKGEELGRNKGKIVGAKPPLRPKHVWSMFGTHSLRRTKATLIYRRTGNLRAVQLLLGHTKIESTVRYLGIEVDDALAIAEQVDVGIWRAERKRSALPALAASGQKRASGDPE